MARPPVCKLMDYGKFKYETAQKAREARKKQVHTVIKEMKLRPKIDPHDYETKKGHVVRFLKAGDKVKITIMFRGREQSRPELGYRLLQRLAKDVEDLGLVETSAKQDGRNMTMVMAPHRKAEERRPTAGRERAAQAAAPSRPHDHRGPDDRGARRRGPDARDRRTDRRTGPAPAGPATSTTPRRAGGGRPPTAPTGAARRRETAAMPKNKTHSGASKRFKVTGSGKLMHARTNRRHLLEHKSSKRMRVARGRQARREGRRAPRQAPPRSLTAPFPRPDIEVNR